MITIDFQDVTEIRTELVHYRPSAHHPRKSEGFYIRKILLTTDSGERVTINLYARTPEALDIHPTIETDDALPCFLRRQAE